MIGQDRGATAYGRRRARSRPAGGLPHFGRNEEAYAAEWPPALSEHVHAVDGFAEIASHLVHPQGQVDDIEATYRAAF